MHTLKNTSRLPDFHAPGKRAFTIVELLVVIAILGMLMGLLTPVVLKFKQKGYIARTKSLILTLKAAAEEYQSEYGDYPPTFLLPEFEEDKNPGIESLVACLHTRHGGPFVEIDEEFLGNVDADYAEENYAGWVFGDLQLREVVDYWGNPLIYFHNRDYPYSQEVTVDGGSDFVEAVKSDETRTFHGVTSFQLWSLGPNGRNDGGKGDDIVSW